MGAEGGTTVDSQLQNYLRATKRHAAADAAAQAEWAAKKWVWIPDKEEGYASAMLESESGETAVVAFENGEVRDLVVSQSDFLILFI